MRVLITGGTGYIGSELVRYLTSLGASVAMLQRYPQEKSGVKCFSYGEDFAGIANAIETFLPDYVVHLAACFDNEDVSELLDCNYKMPIFLLDACAKNSVKRFLYAGSYWQFGDESLVGVPLDLYAASKKSFEEVVNYYAYRRGVKSVELVLYGTYGSNDGRGKIVEYLIESIREDRRIDMSMGEQYLNLVHVDDVCDAFYSCLHRADLAVPHSKFCISSLKQYSLKDIVNTCELRLDKKINVNWGGLSYRSNEVFMPIYAYNRPGFWSEKHNLIDFICDQVER